MDRYEWTTEAGAFFVDRSNPAGPLAVRGGMRAAIDELLRLAERLREAEELLRAGPICPQCLHYNDHAEDCRRGKFLAEGRPAAIEG